MSTSMCVSRRQAREEQQGASEIEEEVASALQELGVGFKRKAESRDTVNAVAQKAVWRERAQALGDLDQTHKRPRQDYEGEQMFDERRCGFSFKNQVILHAFKVAEKEGYVSIVWADEGMPCAYGGVKSVKVNPVHSLAFARLLLNGCFRFEFDEDMFLGKDPQLGLDKKDRQDRKVLEDMLPQQDRTTSQRGFQGANYKCFQNAMGNTSLHTFGLKISSERRVSLWSDWLLGEKQATHEPKEKVDYA